MSKKTSLFVYDDLLLPDFTLLSPANYQLTVNCKQSRVTRVKRRDEFLFVASNVAERINTSSLSQSVNDLIARLWLPVDCWAL
jgi:hypothetical protein